MGGEDVDHTGGSIDGGGTGGRRNPECQRGEVPGDTRHDPRDDPDDQRNN